MSQEERFGVRDLTYSRWHRAASVGRFMPVAEARQLCMIDLDAVEYCDACRRPLALMELARDVGQAHKATSVLQRLAERSRLPAILVFYTPTEDGDISGFRIRVIAPERQVEERLTPEQYADRLRSLRARHGCSAAQREAA